jgi:BASS family bile acid:Na+ symporter
MHNSLEVLDHVRLNFSPSGLLFLNIALAFIMFGVALDIKTEHFTDILKKPKSAIAGFISQVVLLPAVSFVPGLQNQIPPPS